MILLIRKFFSTIIIYLLLGNEMFYTVEAKRFFLNQFMFKVFL